MANDVVIYTSNTCAYCRTTKQYLDKKDVNYEEINVDEQPDRRQELVEMSGQMAVPVVVITSDDGMRDVTVGFNVPKLASSLGL